MTEDVQNRKLFAHPRTGADATLRVAADADGRTWARPSEIVNCACLMNVYSFTLESTNRSIGLICITRNITLSFRSEVFYFMTEQSTLLTLLLERLDNDRTRTSTDACNWTAVDAGGGISAEADNRECQNIHVRTSL